MKRRFLLAALSILSLIAVAQPASAQTPPILPTDVSGPTAGGGGPAAMMREMGAPAGFNDYTAQPSWFDRHFRRNNLYGRVLTYPAVVPYSGGAYLQPSIIEEQSPYMWYPQQTMPEYAE